MNGSGESSQPERSGPEPRTQNPEPSSELTGHGHVLRQEPRMSTMFPKFHPVIIAPRIIAPVIMAGALFW